MGAALDPPYVVRGDRGLMMTRGLGDRWSVQHRPAGRPLDRQIAFTRTDALIELKRAGVPDRVLAAMVGMK